MSDRWIGSGRELPSVDNDRLDVRAVVAELEQRRRRRRRERDTGTALALLVIMLGLAVSMWGGATLSLRVVSGPWSLIDATRQSIADLLAGTVNQPTEDRRARIEEAVRQSEARLRQETPADGSDVSQGAPPGTPVATPTASETDRLQFILGQALTSYADLPPDWETNIDVATKRLNGKTVAAGEVFSFTEAIGPVDAGQGFRTNLPDALVWGSEQASCVAGGVCQVSSLLLQAAFDAGLEVVEHHHFPGWLAAYGDGQQRLPGLDARVGPGADLKFRNTTGDMLRIEAWTDGRNAGIVLYGVDPGWTVQRESPIIGTRVPAPTATVRREAPLLAAGQDYTVAAPADGFTVQLSRLLIRRGQVIDRYQQTVQYQPQPGVMVVGVLGATPTPTPTLSPTPLPTATATPPAQTPGPDTNQPQVTPRPTMQGMIRVPSVIGLPEAEARRRIEAAGLTNTFTNYQGPRDVPDAVLTTVAAGQVLSQSPAPNTQVPRGEIVYIAVRRD